MSLFNLVKLRQALTNTLDANSVIEPIQLLRDRINNIKFQVDVLSPEHVEYINGLVSYYENLIVEAEKPVKEFEQQLAKLNNEINAVTRQLFTNNYELEERYGSAEQVRITRRLPIADEIKDTVKQRILLHTSWKYPALEIGCRDGEWTEHLVAADPLYIIDPHKDFLDSTNSKFPELFQSRLRKYQLKNNDLSALPKNQFGFVFSWNYFNYVSLDTMHQFLKQAFEVLRPGGIFMFSYNDGDTPAGAGMAESFSQSYMPKSILVPLCLSLGFTIADEYDFEPNTSWLELKKPGTLHTIKSHQVLGEIIYKNFAP